MVFAQPRMDVQQEIVNMGEIMFQQPNAATFQLKNTGSEPLNITNVQPSCGCIKVEWPRTPIAPQQTATITALYDAKILGTFQKEIEVWTNVSNEPVYLTFQGRVVTSASDYDGDYPIDLGIVRLSSNEFEFDDVNSGDNPEVVLQIVNTGRSSYTPQIMHLPSYLSAHYQPERLAGGRVGRIILTLDSERLKNYGLTQTTVYLARYPGDKVCTENEISVSAVLLPAFAQLTAEQMRTAPHLSLSEDTIDFGAFGSKKKLTKTITLSNTGKRPLTISAVQVYSKALSVHVSNRIIQPGKQAKMKVTLESSYLSKYKSMPRILLIVDDPDCPKITIKCTAKP